MHETVTPIMPPTAWNDPNLSARTADVAATMIEMMITTVE